MTEAFPLQWPIGRPRIARKERSRFDVTFAKARDELFKELHKMGARLPVLSTNVPLRRDGLPYANQPEPDDSGVAVYFTWKDKQMSFCCDRWDRVRDNVQAIRHTIAALRGLDRWGTGDMIEAAFRGFEALPAPKGKDWHDVIGVSKSDSFEIVRGKFKEMYQCAENDDSRIELNNAYQEAKSFHGR